jgi:peptidoglycan/xylan/chitin deacetylase (PgdA/CDA1 family)
MPPVNRRAPLLLLAALAVVPGCGGSHSSSTSPASQRGRARPPRAPDVSAAPRSPRSPTARPSAHADPPSASAAAQEAAVQDLLPQGLPVYCGGTQGHYVAFTFDDGPGPYTRLALRKLRAHHERATFFLVGKQLATQPQSLVREETELGTVGDHTWTHPVLPALSPDRVRQEMATTKLAVARASGTPVTLFRPPYGARTPAIDRQARQLGMLEVIWDVDSRDSEGANYAGIASNVIRGMVPGSIVLMHENRGQTIRALLTILPELRRRHLRAVSVQELLALDPPTDRQLRQGPRGCAPLRNAAPSLTGGG